MSISLEERLAQEPIRLLINGGRLDVVLNAGAPDDYVLPNDVDELLANELKRIGRRASDIRQKLTTIVDGRTVEKWQRFHNRLIEYKRWPEEVMLVNPYACLCSWADCHRHIAEAKNGADVSWNTRRLPAIEATVVHHGMLSEAFHRLVMDLRA